VTGKEVVVTGSEVDVLWKDLQLAWSEAKTTPPRRAVQEREQPASRRSGIWQPTGLIRTGSETTRRGKGRDGRASERPVRFQRVPATAREIAAQARRFPATWKRLPDAAAEVARTFPRHVDGGTEIVRTRSEVKVRSCELACAARGFLVMGARFFVTTREVAVTESEIVALGSERTVTLSESTVRSSASVGISATAARGDKPLRGGMAVRQRSGPCVRAHRAPDSAPSSLRNAKK